MGNPKIEIETTFNERLIDWLGFLLLAILIVLPLYFYNSLSDEIPTHFNLNGEVDRYSSKVAILILPIIGFMTFILMFYLNKVPHRFNYLRPITEENAKFQYTIATKMLRRLNLLTTAMFLYITYYTITIAHSNNVPNVNWILILFIIGIFVLIAYFTKLSAKKV